MFNICKLINIRQNKNLMIFSIDAEKDFDKIQHPLIMKVGMERKYLNKIKSTYNKPNANIRLNGEKWKPFPPKSGAR
jgi:hypothetical protein